MKISRSTLVDEHNTDHDELLISGDGAPAPLATAMLEEAIANASTYAELNSMAYLDLEGAYREAEACDREARQGSRRGPLHGIPVTIKDLYAVSGMPTKAGTKATIGLQCGPEATAVKRLRAAGAVLLGKTNMHEVALGLTGENEWTGDVLNPHDPTRMAGGSSSGSAVAVATGIGVASLATDTAGSIRLPASFCGVVGFKPSFGWVPLDGALALSPSCDHGGPIARNVHNARRLYEVLADSKFARDGLRSLTDVRIGIPVDFLDGRLCRDVRLAFESLQRRLEERGAEVRRVSLRMPENIAGMQANACWPEAYRIHEEALAREPQNFSAKVRTALEYGRDVRAHQFLAAREERRASASAIHRGFMSGLDVLLVPASPVAAPKRGTTTVEIEAGTVLLRDALLPLLAPFSLAGVPVVSLPFAIVDGLPVNVQVIAARSNDARCLDIASLIENIATF
ncbi:amidase [Paraburkholderia fungorum]|uniref:amidase n=1 Tax=Paraburkholderia fungorum TaxID=134537 RepID=UPI0038BA05A9